jgi:hypothetical protein
VGPVSLSDPERTEYSDGNQVSCCQEVAMGKEFGCDERGSFSLNDVELCQSAFKYLRHET